MRIGILGGTFDPIHKGHTGPAEEVKHALELDEIWLMPNHIPPHKQGPKVTTAQRLAMTKLACQHHPDFKVCDIEAQRNTPSYTSETLAQLTQYHPRHEFYFIMGMDSFVNLQKWHHWQNIFDHAHIVVCQRPGAALPSTSPSAQLLEQNRLAAQTSPTATHGHILLVETTQVDFSSTQIRTELALGHTPNGLEEKVMNYITKNRLYYSAA